MNKLNKLIFGWQLIASIMLGVVFIGFYTTDLGITTSVLLTIGGSLLIASLILYETKVHLSIILVFASELAGFLAYLAQNQSEVVITAELAISTICLFSGTYIIVSKIRKNKAKLNVNNIVYTNIKPFKIPVIAKIIVISCMITLIFTIASSYQESNTNITLMSIIITLLPTFILLLSIVPIRETIYLRIVYYILQISIVVMAINIGKANVVMFVEPTIDILSIIFGRIYSISEEQEELKVIQNVNEEKQVLIK